MINMIDFSTASLETLIAKEGHDCACGRHHSMVMDYIRKFSEENGYTPSVREIAKECGIGEVPVIATACI